MRILIAAKHAPHGGSIGGVQSYCRTVADELADRGHTVETWGPEQDSPPRDFDLGIIANVSDTYKILGRCAKRIIISHGIIPAENPCLGSAHKDPVVYTSEEVRDHWGVEGTVIRQPIASDYWHPSDCDKKFMVRFSYRRGLPFIPKIAKSMGLEYRHVRNYSPERVREVLRQSAVCIATGRAALEAISTGVPTILCDHRSAYQKPLMHTGNLTTGMLRNYSGRGGITPTEENVRLEIKKAIERGSMRDHVLKYHNVSKVTTQLLDAAYE